jgi:RimJ/RimL family protein N-acetyltransferase
MKFKTKYSCLSQNEFQNGLFKIIPIRYEDRIKIMNWRNEQMYHLRQNVKLTKENQENYFKKVVSELFEQEMPNQILFSFMKDNICIGYGGLVHINWIDKNAEISFVMNTNLEKENFSSYWSIFLNLIEQVTFNELNFHKFFTFACDLRPQLYEAIENAGWAKEAVLRNHFYLNGEFKNIVIHSKFNTVK